MALRILPNIILALRARYMAKLCPRLADWDRWLIDMAGQYRDSAQNAHVRCRAFLFIDTGLSGSAGLPGCTICAVSTGCFWTTEVYVSHSQQGAVSEHNLVGESEGADRHFVG